MRIARFSLAVLLGLTCSMAACSSDSKGSSSSASSSQSGDQASGSAVVVEIRDKALQPAAITVKVGGTVTWKFDDGGVTHDIEGAIFGSGPKSEGTYEFTFPDAGTSTYHCVIHPEMEGTITVA
jgi:plastocyanin